MTLANILFIIVMLHLAVGFGYVIYKLEFEGRNKKKTTVDDKSGEKEETKD